MGQSLHPCICLTCCVEAAASRRRRRLRVCREGEEHQQQAGVEVGPEWVDARVTPGLPPGLWRCLGTGRIPLPASLFLSETVFPFPPPSCLPAMSSFWRRLVCVRTHTHRRLSSFRPAVPRWWETRTAPCSGPTVSRLHNLVNGPGPTFESMACPCQGRLRACFLLHAVCWAGLGRPTGRRTQASRPRQGLQCQAWLGSSESRHRPR
jgi:hypothetical protein